MRTAIERRNEIIEWVNSEGKVKVEDFRSIFVNCWSLQSEVVHFNIMLSQVFVDCGEN